MTERPTISKFERGGCELFLEALRQGATVSKAAATAGVVRTTPYRWREEDEEFAKAWDDAVEEGTDRIEDEAFRRAVEGVDEPVFQQGKQVGTVRRYSDNLIDRLLRARRPEKFKDRVANEVTGKDGGPIQGVGIVTDDPVEAAKVYQRLVNGG